MTDALKPFPDEWFCTAWEDCDHDGICHDPKNCGAIGPNHGAFYGLTDEEADALPEPPPCGKENDHEPRRD